MKHEQRTIHEPSSSAVEDAGKSTSSRYWTSVDAGYSVDEGYVRTLPGRKVSKFKMQELNFLEKIGEGGQGIIHNVQLVGSFISTEEYKPLLVVKQYKGGRCGQWPETVFDLHLSSPFVCRFWGYCLGESFYLVMAKYSCTLGDVLDKKMKQAKFAARPLSDFVTLTVIIEIAMGMWFLHENNIIHGDLNLKAVNVFVFVDQSGNPLAAYVGDFDVASYVVGTLFWRAPEVLQALKDRKGPVFTPKADVYSFAMTCYEILTGGVPLEGLGASDYDAVLVDRKRPKLPSNLNPKLKDFVSRCWHLDPEVRPPFKEIVVELKELHRELITGSKIFSNFLDGIFSAGSSSEDIIRAGPEANLVELKTLLRALLVKYNQADCLLLCGYCCWY